jgi:hypothetical protein
MEIWKNIPTFEGEYQVSNMGNVKSLRFNKVKILKQGIQTQGYCIVDLKGKSFRVHSLVIWAFKGVAPTGKVSDFVIDHIDDNKTNNKLENLNIVSHRENITKNTNPTGARLDKRTNNWLCKIKINNKVHYLGSFKTKEEAEIRYKKELNNLNL